MVSVNIHLACGLASLCSLSFVGTDLSLCKDELVRTRNLLEAAQEDVQLTRMSLSEKSTELLEAQDRLL